MTFFLQLGTTSIQTWSEESDRTKLSRVSPTKLASKYDDAPLKTSYLKCYTSHPFAWSFRFRDLDNITRQNYLFVEICLIKDNNWSSNASVHEVIPNSLHMYHITVPKVLFKEAVNPMDSTSHAIEFKFFLSNSCIQTELKFFRISTSRKPCRHWILLYQNCYNDT